MGTKMKESGIPWIGMIPDNWEVKRLKEVFVECKEKSLDGAGELLSLSQYTGVQQKKDTDKAGTHESETYEGYNVVHKGQLVMNIMLAWNGSYAISDYDGIISPAYCVFDFRIDCAKQYFHYLLRTNGYPSAFKTLSRGIIDSRLRLYPEQFYTFPTIFPPLPTQQRIADFLDRKCAEIDELAALQETMIAELKRYKQSLITETVTKGLDPNVPMKDSGVEWIGEIPSHWTETKVLNVLSMPITDGPHETPNLYDTGIPFISADAVSDEYINFDNKRGFISQAYYEECCKKYIPQKYDIYMIKSGASTGRTAIVETDEIFTIWSPLAVFRANRNMILPFFLLYVLRSYGFQKQVETNWSYGTQQNIGMRTLEKLIVSYPSLSEQQQIADYLDRKCAEIDELIAIKQQKIEALKEYKKSVIFEYVTGKKDAE